MIEIILVVLDSNIFVRDFFLRSPNFRLLLEWLRAEGGDLFLPRVVIDEVVTKYGQELSRLNEQHSSVHKELQRFLNGTAVANEILDEDALRLYAFRYHWQLLHKLKKVNTVILPYPATSHEEVARRAMRRQRPFQDKGTGYRDILIWRTVVELAKEEPGTVAFVSNNKKDFAENGELHSDLLHDLTLARIPEGKVLYFDSLDSFVSSHVRSAFKEVENIKSLIASRSYEGLDIERFLHAKLRDNIQEMLSTQPLAMPPESALQARITSMLVTDLQVESVVRLSPEEIFVAGTAKAEVNISLPHSPAGVRVMVGTGMDAKAFHFPPFGSGTPLVLLEGAIPLEFELSYETTLHTITGDSLQYSLPWSQS